MSVFRLHWDANVDISPMRQITIRESEESCNIQVGDQLYVITDDGESRLLARIVVNEHSKKPDRQALVIDVDDPKTAFFFRKHRDAVGVQSLEKAECQHRTAIQLPEDVASSLVSLCGTHDFSSIALPPTWPGTVRSVEKVAARAFRDGDPRPSLEVAVDYLRDRYVTSELPGPSPVYVNAARRALGPSFIIENKRTHTRKSIKTRIRHRGPLTDKALESGINDDAARIMSGSPDTLRHQIILRRLRDRLQALGLNPLYDGFVDCILEDEHFDLYFEVKSAMSECLNSQMRLGVGQLLHYIWMDSRQTEKKISGYLVLEDVSDRPLNAREFIQSLSLKLIWSSEIDDLGTQDLLQA